MWLLPTSETGLCAHTWNYTKIFGPFFCDMGDSLLAEVKVPTLSSPTVCSGIRRLCFMQVSVNRCPPLKNFTIYKYRTIVRCMQAFKSICFVDGVGSWVFEQHHRPTEAIEAGRRPSVRRLAQVFSLTQNAKLVSARVRFLLDMVALLHTQQ